MLCYSDDEGEHVYVQDPNGLVIELAVAEPPWPDRADSADVLQRWIDTTR